MFAHKMECQNEGLSLDTAIVLTILHYLAMFIVWKGDDLEL